MLKLFKALNSTLYGFAYNKIYQHSPLHTSDVEVFIDCTALQSFCNWGRLEMDLIGERKFQMSFQPDIEMCHIAMFFDQV